jgi:hypothetical protein
MTQVSAGRATNRATLIRKAVVASHLEFFAWRPKSGEPLSDQKVEEHVAVCTSCSVAAQQLPNMSREHMSRYDLKVMARVELLAARPDIAFAELLRQA